MIDAPIRDSHHVKVIRRAKIVFSDVSHVS
jgi:hypothetical protein